MATLWRAAQWPIIGGLWLLAALLGYVGFSRHLTAAGLTASHLDYLYMSAQLFVMDSGAVSGFVPWQLEAARWLAPAVAAYTAFRALATVFREQARAIRMRTLRHHTVVCGYGRKGAQLVSDLSACGEPVIVIDHDEQRKEACEAEAPRVYFLHGDATDPRLLRQARVNSARHLIAACGDDGTNIEIAARAYRGVQGLHRPPLQCRVHIVDARLCHLFKQHRIFTTPGDPFEASVFNIYENAARLMIRNHPLDHGRIRVANLPGVQGLVPHLVVVGFGQMGTAVALQAIKMAHFANGSQLRLSIVDRRAGLKEKRFLESYPRARTVCDLRFIEGDADDPETVGRLLEPAADPTAIFTVAVCQDDQLKAFACAMGIVARLRDRQDVPVLVRMSEATGIGSLLETVPEGLSRRMNVHAFGTINEVCTWELVAGDRLDTLARARHNDTVRRRRTEGRPATDPTMRPWNQTDEGFRDSSRQQTDHIPIKLAAIACVSAPLDTGRAAITSFQPEELEALSRMEHARWIAERTLANWTLGPRDPERKVSPWLIPWEELPDNIRQYDREAVQDIPRILGLIGERVYRQKPPA